MYLWNLASFFFGVVLYFGYKWMTGSKTHFPIWEDECDPQIENACGKDANCHPDGPAKRAFAFRRKKRVPAKMSSLNRMARLNNKTLTGVFVSFVVILALIAVVRAVFPGALYDGFANMSCYGVKCNEGSYCQEGVCRPINPGYTNDYCRQGC
jgi:hypothetical protein